MSQAQNPKSNKPTNEQTDNQATNQGAENQNPTPETNKETNMNQAKNNQQQATPTPVKARVIEKDDGIGWLGWTGIAAAGVATLAAVGLGVRALVNHYDKDLQVSASLPAPTDAGMSVAVETVANALGSSRVVL